MDADRHISSLSRIYFLLVIISTTFSILFSQQVIKSRNTLAVQRLELINQTYYSIFLLT